MQKTMAGGCRIFVLLIAISGSIGYVAPNKEPVVTEFLDEQTDYMAAWLQIQNKVLNDPELKAEWDRRVMLSKIGDTRDWELPTPKFECDTSLKSASIPTSVHQLRPGDITVVAAMGDSVSAGNGVDADSIAEVGTQNRGEVFSAGGDLSLDDGVITLPNILRKFNPDLKGQSVCKGGRSDERRAWMNLAMPGGTNPNMPFQAWDIINRVAQDDRIDTNVDWKLVTLLIGGNDLCQFCRNDNLNATNFKKRIQETLEIFHDNLPRTLVNLVPMFDVTPLANFTNGEGSNFCHLAHTFFCSCVKNEPERVRPEQLEFYYGMKDLAESGIYEKEDFSVVVQPVMVDITPPIDFDTGEPDRGFLSHDCFHPSLKAHQGFAYLVWQSMMIPVGEKPLTWNLYEQNPAYICPTEENPYIFTSGNSGP